MGHLKLVEYGRIHSVRAASSVAQGLHCASLLRWVNSEEEGAAGLDWSVDLVSPTSEASSLHYRIYTSWHSEQFTNIHTSV